MKKIAISILIGILFTTSVVSYSEGLSDDISQAVVRLHIVADSNDAEDQRVKLLVRDRILEKMKDFKDEHEIEENIDFFTKEANAVLTEEGFSYKAAAEFGVFEFPTKYYDGFALPKGKYKAVRIKLGEAKGENWWCVMFPPLCMVDAATGEQEALLKETFGENYSVVAGDGKPEFKIKFKLAELF